MEQELIEQLCKKTSNEKYHKFLRDYGYQYASETDALNGFVRWLKSNRGTLLAEDEFLAELGAGQSDILARQLYDKLRTLVEEKALTAMGVYNYAKYRWCRNHPEAVIAYRIDRCSWVVNNCSMEIPEERAVLLVNSEWGFEASRIKLRDTPYYEAADMNFISFQCGPLGWVMRNGDLYQIYE